MPAVPNLLAFLLEAALAALRDMWRKSFYYLTHWEEWHWFAKYIIIGPAWIWLCIKSRSLWFFTSSNPGITFGGFQGETKKQTYEQLPPGTYPKSIYIRPQTSFPEVEQAVADEFRFPVVVKPDVGMMGLMFRKIESRQQLRQYHEAMKAEYIVQEFIDLPIEVSVFYYRIPGESKGYITGFIRKEGMEVTGDGRSTLRNLILNYPRAQFYIKELFGKHHDKLDIVLTDKEAFVLSDALNLSRGGRLVNINHEIDRQLLRVFDELSLYTNFYYGRYDIRCNSIEDLKAGKNFSIIEFNGCGGEAHHVYSGYSFFEACSILVEHWNILYDISMKNIQKGIKPWEYSKGAKFMLNSNKHINELMRLDASLHFKPELEQEFADFVDTKDFPCIAAKAAVAKDQICVMICDHVACPKDDQAITEFIYNFVDGYRSGKKMYTSAVIIFKEPQQCSEEYFDTMMWQRLQGVADHDQQTWDPRVSSDPSDADFSFSVKEEAFYIIGLHPGSSRKARQFQYPAIVFNPHDQFERLRATHRYETMKETVRKRDIVFSGSVNPMLTDFGKSSEAVQYSGRVYDATWKCPFNPNTQKE
ncbi:MAG TPA: guanitoxin biosynthesis heme-dependent pre-guanitoxin N-hydroxylase GntA [Cyclobacteriaceae bacterium]